MALLLTSLCLGGTTVTIPTITVDNVGQHVRVFHLEAAQSTNITAIRSRKGIVVIDTEVCPVFTKAIRDRIQEEFPSTPFFCLINTHEHGDHTYGNQVFSDIPIIAHEGVRKGMTEGERQREQKLKQLGAVLPMLNKRMSALPAESEAYTAMQQRCNYYAALKDGLENGFQLTLPTITFSDALTLDLGDITLHLTWYGKSHSDSDILIQCPEEGILLTGDLFAPGIDPYVDSDRITHMDRWIRTLEHTLADPDPIGTIIPGHGEYLSRDVLTAALEFARTQQALYDGKSSSFVVFKETMEKAGLEQALNTLKSCFTEPDRYYTLHPEIDSFGYRLMLDGQVDDALAIFTALAEIFPENDMAFDSLGEAYLRKGNKEQARTSFQRAVALNPENGNAAAKLASLEESEGRP